MAQVIFETIIRGQSYYHKINRFPTTIGRAFDNDIILSELSVSPYHLEIDQDENGYVVRNISAENGTLLDNKNMNMLAASVNLPVLVNLGDLKARILSHKTTVEPTRIKIESKGLFRFLSHPVWVAFLFILTLSFIFLDFYQSIPVEKDPLFYLNQLLPTFFIMIGITLVISGISRLVTHRWEILPALTIATLFFLIPLMLSYLGHFFNYLFTSNVPGDISINIAHFVVLPILLMFYMVRVHLTPLLPALGAAILMSSPVSAYHLNEYIDQLSTHSGFSPLPPYNKTLNVFNIHTAESISVADYFKDADRILSEQTTIMLNKKLEKE